jgi:2-polyprenyl-3-methyl-5-hydroxy-6-metoxy-1,4-benzoquinol methylase
MNKINLSSYFENNYRSLVKRYNFYDTEDIHKSWITTLNFQGLKVLDVGSGSGRDALYYASQGAEVTAIDFSSNMISYAKTKDYLNKVNWIEDELPNLISQEHTSYFDLIAATAILMFLSPEDQIVALKRLSELLCANGKIIITFKEDLEDNLAYKLSPVFINTAKNLGFEVKIVDGGVDKNSTHNVYWTLFILSL